MRRETEERRLLVRFLKIVTRIIYGGTDEVDDQVKSSAVGIGWDTVELAYVRMAVNDFVEQLQDVSGDHLEAIDKILSENGAYTLTQARDKGFRRAMQLMSFPKIRKESDAYLLKGIIDSGDKRFTQDQLIRMERLLDTYQE